MSSVTCDAMREDLSAFADGELEGARDDAVRDHVARCARCRGSLAAWRAAGSRLRAIQPGDGLAAARVLATVRRALAPPERRWAAVAAMATVALAVLVLESRARAERGGRVLVALESQNRAEASRQRDALEALRLDLAALAVRSENGDVPRNLNAAALELESLRQRLLALERAAGHDPILEPSHATDPR